MKVITLKIRYQDEDVCDILGIMPLIIHFYWFRLIRSDSGFVYSVCSSPTKRLDLKKKKKDEGCYNSHYHPSVGIIWDQEEHPMILEKIEVCDSRFLKSEGFLGLKKS